jgi:hypothetical protein
MKTRERYRMMNLAESGGRSVGHSIGEWVVEAGSVTMPGDDDDTSSYPAVAAGGDCR